MTTTTTTTHDTIIIGAGPAGLCAAMYAGRGMLNAVVLERGIPGGELLNTEKVEDYPGFETILGRDLAKKFADHAVKFGANIKQENVEGVTKDADGWFTVTTSFGGASYRAPTVIITAGGTPTKLDVPGELDYAGRGVSYCAVCDGAFFKGETIAVIGGGDAAVEEADYLTRYASKVYLVHRRDSLRASKILQERLFANPKIELVWNKKVLEMTGEATGLKAIALEDTVTGAKSELAVTGAGADAAYDSVVPQRDWAEGSRVHTADAELASVLATALAAWSVDGSLVLSRGPEPEGGRGSRLASEGVTVEA
jgi:thioredoxin reductase (NADPH)